MIEKSVDAQFNKVEHLGKAIRSAIIGIGRLARFAIGEVEEQTDVATAVRGREIQKVRMIAEIHGEKVVELIKVGEIHFARALMADGVAALARRLDHARIRRIANMPGAGAGGINKEIDVSVSGPGSQYAFRRR